MELFLVQTHEVEMIYNFIHSAEIEILPSCSKYRKITHGK